MGCPKINIQIRTSNTEVIEFYRRIGFTPTGESDSHPMMSSAWEKGLKWIQKSGFRKEVVLELEQLAVRPDSQGQGVSTALIQESLGQVARMLKGGGACIKNIVVTTRTDNHAQRLYRKVLGAAPEAVIKDLYSADEVIMVARNTGGRLDRY
jgi:ribosomal protein S18 acetylase RimI-like enzyme